MKFLQPFTQQNTVCQPFVVYRIWLASVCGIPQMVDSPYAAFCKWMTAFGMISYHIWSTICGIPQTEANHIRYTKNG